MSIPRFDLRFLGAVGFLVCFTSCFVAYSAERPDIASALDSGQLKQAQESLSKFVAANPKDDLARFELGAVEFFAAIEGLAQDSFRYGLQPNFGAVPFLRTPIKPNRQPEAISYDAARQMIDRFIQRLEHAEQTLSSIEDKDLKWELDITKVRLDMNGDGQADKDESLWKVFNEFARNRRFDGSDSQATPDSFKIGLDSGDAHWLRGYCHLLAALGDFVLAYDEQRLFDRTAQLFFANPQTKYAAILTRHGADTRPVNETTIMDAVAFVHLMDFSVREPDRLAHSREHLLGMVSASRQSWELIEAETDNDHEWIPGPNQASVVEGVAINKERLAAWRKFLSEAEDVLNGKKLIPFWRGSSGKGLNLRRAFTEPKHFDLVLWVQGSDAVPYLEEGELTSPQTWMEFQRVFQGRFIGMAIWIN